MAGEAVQAETTPDSGKFNLFGIPIDGQKALSAGWSFATDLAAGKSIGEAASSEAVRDFAGDTVKNGMDAAAETVSANHPEYAAIANDFSAAGKDVVNGKPLGDAVVDRVADGEGLREAGAELGKQAVDEVNRQLQEAYPDAAWATDRLAEFGKQVIDGKDVETAAGDTFLNPATVKEGGKKLLQSGIDKVSGELDLPDDVRSGLSQFKNDIIDGKPLDQAATDTLSSLSGTAKTQAAQAIDRLADEVGAGGPEYEQVRQGLKDMSSKMIDGKPVTDAATESFSGKLKPAAKNVVGKQIDRLADEIGATSPQLQGMKDRLKDMSQKMIDGKSIDEAASEAFAGADAELKDQAKKVLGDVMKQTADEMAKGNPELKDAADKLQETVDNAVDKGMDRAMKDSFNSEGSKTVTDEGIQEAAARSGDAQQKKAAEDVKVADESGMLSERSRYDDKDASGFPKNIKDTFDRGTAQSERDLQFAEGIPVADAEGTVILTGRQGDVVLSSVQVEELTEELKPQEHPREDGRSFADDAVREPRGIRVRGYFSNAMPSPPPLDRAAALERLVAFKESAEILKVFTDFPPYSDEDYLVTSIRSRHMGSRSLQIRRSDVTASYNDLPTEDLPGRRRRNIDGNAIAKKFLPVFNSLGQLIGKMEESAAKKASSTPGSDTTAQVDDQGNTVAVVNSAPSNNSESPEASPVIIGGGSDAPETADPRDNTIPISDEQGGTVDAVPSGSETGQQTINPKNLPSLAELDEQPEVQDANIADLDEVLRQARERLANTSRRDLDGVLPGDAYEVTIDIVKERFVEVEVLGGGDTAQEVSQPSKPAQDPVTGGFPEEAPVPDQGEKPPAVEDDPDEAVNDMVQGATDEFIRRNSLGELSDSIDEQNVSEGVEQGDTGQGQTDGGGGGGGGGGSEPSTDPDEPPEDLEGQSLTEEEQEEQDQKGPLAWLTDNPIANKVKELSQTPLGQKVLDAGEDLLNRAVPGAGAVARDLAEGDLSWGTAIETGLELIPGVAPIESAIKNTTGIDITQAVGDFANGMIENDFDVKKAMHQEFGVHPQWWDAAGSAISGDWDAARQQSAQAVAGTVMEMAGEQYDLPPGAQQIVENTISGQNSIEEGAGQFVGAYMNQISQDIGLGDAGNLVGSWLGLPQPPGPEHQMKRGNLASTTGSPQPSNRTAVPLDEEGV